MSETDPTVDRMTVRLETVTVDRHVVVIPAKGDQVVRVGSTTVTPGHDVMNLEAVATSTAVNHTPIAITADDYPA